MLCLHNSHARPRISLIIFGFTFRLCSCEMAEESNSTLDVLQTYEETTSGKRPSPHSSQENNPMTIDETIALVMSTDGNSSRQLKSTAHRLMKLSETNLRSYTSDGLDPLTVLDPQAHSLAYLFFLCVSKKETLPQEKKPVFRLVNILQP